MNKDRFSEHTEDGKDGYTYFRPEYFLKYGFITEEEVERLAISGAKILSVGAGPAYLEQWLVEKGIPRDNIVLIDIDEEYKPEGFKVYYFDMLNDWPEVEEGPFDLIIAPEAFTVALWPFPHNGQLGSGLGHLIKEAMKLLKPDGVFRMIDPATRKGSGTDEIIEIARKKLASTRVTLEVSNEILNVKNETASNRV